MSVYPLDGLAGFVAAIPHLMGLHPHRSLVVGGLDASSRLTGLLHVELAEAEESADVATHLVAVLGRYRPRHVVLAVIDDRTFESHEPMGHSRLVTDVTTGFDALGVDVARVVWAASTMPGSRCCTTTGDDIVPDLDTSTLAVSRIASGRVTYPSRAAIAADLAPSDPDAVTRRERHLRQGQAPKAPVAVIQSALTRVVEGWLPTADEEITSLARAIRTPEGNVTALYRTVTDPRRARELWVCLTRALPAPWRADAAVLTAVATYLADEGVIATVALDLAKNADSNHALADLMRRAVAFGLSPTALGAALRRLADDLADLTDREA